MSQPGMAPKEGDRGGAADAAFSGAAEYADLKSGQPGQTKGQVASHEAIVDEPSLTRSTPKNIGELTEWAGEPDYDWLRGTVDPRDPLFDKYPEALRKPKPNHNTYALENISKAALSSSRNDLFSGLGQYIPEYGNDADNVRVYNMGWRTMVTTPKLEYGSAGLERPAAQRLKALEEELFGPEGPEFVRTEETLRSATEVYDWFGQPIQLTLGDSPEIWLDRYDEVRAGQAEVKWYLRSPDRRTVVPPDGTALDREQKVRLMPQDDGRIRISDYSAHGTQVREGHWQKRRSPDQPYG